MMHRDLVVAAGRWLTNTRRCGFVLLEKQSATSETPDAIGWKIGANVSYLVECKTSRADFFADADKPHRGDKGMGSHRYFLTPKGLVTPEEVPSGWGLLEVKHLGYMSRIHVRVEATHRILSADLLRHEMSMLYAALLRVKFGAFIVREEQPDEPVAAIAS